MCLCVHGMCMCVHGTYSWDLCAWDVHNCMHQMRMGCVRVHGMHTVACISRARGMCVRARDAHVCVQGVCTSMCRALCTQRPRSRTSRCTPGPAGSSVGDAGRRWDGRSPPGAVWVGVGAELDGRGVPGGGRWGSPAGCDPPRICVSPDTCRNSNVICKLTMGSLRFIFNYNVCTNLNSPLFINNAWVCVYRCLINLCLRQLKACKIPKGGGGERLRGSRGSTGRSCGSGGGAAAGQPLQRGGSGEQPRAHRPSAPPPSLPQFPHSPSHLSRCALPARCSPLPPPHPLRPPPWRGRGVRAVGASPALAL